MNRLQIEQRNKLLLDNIRLLNKIAYGINRRELQDAQHTVYKVFLEEYPRYNDKKAALTTWIMSHVRLKAIREYTNTYNSIRLPDYVRTIQYLLNKGKLNGSIEEFRILRDRNIEPFKRLSEKNYVDIISLLARSDSLVKSYTDEMLTNIKERTQVENDSCIKDNYLTEVEQRMEEALRISTIYKCFKGLSNRELYIIAHRFGINDVQLKTFGTLASELNISSERVRQIQLKAIKKIQKISRKYFTVVD